MKRVLYILPALFLIVFACKKDQETKPNHRLPATDSSLMGAWKLSSYAQSSGGPVIWQPATADIRYAFYSANVFQSYGDSGKFDHYMITTGISTTAALDTILKIYQHDKADTAYYYLKITTDTLYLNNIGCIEGCGSKFIRSGTIVD
ncbi:hypothetical protein SAMN05428988_3705 [Chitinophaga sp. YR573]|uniref:hypothetical protein n=1 Tax=Chitinophaga sp. YR573 TaxID=1881040 RepID=UPI0008AFC8F9|nr:hypothetical protein [Chitinophaga sp. YR573]SEW25989.1 hypothetical protein SAMN05428988_3705 [Chitinophaga sp. YR573]